jgi:hypothetical protein
MAQTTELPPRGEGFGPDSEHHGENVPNRNTPEEQAVVDEVSKILE